MFARRIKRIKTVKIAKSHVEGQIERDNPFDGTPYSPMHNDLGVLTNEFPLIPSMPLCFLPDHEDPFLSGHVVEPLYIRA